jgi:mono/diheme cytochrome c family protein
MTPIIANLALLLAQVAGNQEFAIRCAACHGADGRGGERGPAIVLRGRSDQDLRDLIRKGFPDAGMPGFEIPEPRLAAIVGYVRSLGESRQEGTVSLELQKRRTVSFADLVEPKPGDCGFK